LDRYAAARKVADEIYASRESPFRVLRDDLDAEFIALVQRMCAVTEAP